MRYSPPDSCYRKTRPTIKLCCTPKTAKKFRKRTKLYWHLSGISKNSNELSLRLRYVCPCPIFINPVKPLGVRDRIFHHRATAFNRFGPTLCDNKWRGPVDGLGGQSIFEARSLVANALYKWAVASLFILCVGVSMAELASAAPTSGGVRMFRI